MNIAEGLLQSWRQRNQEAFVEAVMAVRRTQETLEAHRHFHRKVGCPGRPECYVCAEEEWMETHNQTLVDKLREAK